MKFYLVWSILPSASIHRDYRCSRQIDHFACCVEGILIHCLAE